jgi:hypothetical protein
MVFTVLQQRRAGRLAAVRPEQEGEPFIAPGLPSASGATRG